MLACVQFCYRWLFEELCAQMDDRNLFGVLVRIFKAYYTMNLFFNSRNHRLIRDVFVRIRLFLQSID